jgi:hypothetical protein
MGHWHDWSRLWILVFAQKICHVLFNTKLIFDAYWLYNFGFIVALSWRRKDKKETDFKNILRRRLLYFQPFCIFIVGENVQNIVFLNT